MKLTDVEHRVLAAVGRAMGEFSMLRPGDRVAVGVSGGKNPGVPRSIEAALANVNADLLFTPTFSETVSAAAGP